jgi:hypothetical protein
MLHGCGRADMVKIGTLFDRLYTVAAEAMPGHAEEYLK